jgi:hypothetical protein
MIAGNIALYSITAYKMLGIQRIIALDVEGINLSNFEEIKMK